jgi:ATP-dependent helicase HrpB
VILPIDRHIPAILKSLSESTGVVVQASPGSGKTTRLPPAILKTIEPENSVYVLEPRRLASKMAASRVAYEMNEDVGQTVGYQFRFENVTGPKTRLKFLTEGMLVRQLLSDPLLKNISVVVLDEFHERHIHTDVALSYLRHLQKNQRPDLKIVAMSATLETEGLARFLGDVPIFEIDAPNFEVAVEYQPPTSTLENSVAKAVQFSIGQALRDPDGRSDILVFLPGMNEIRRVREGLSSLAAKSDSVVLALHGELSRQEQDLALNPSPKRKIILSTNVAESSVTINGITTVIDSGLVRQASHSWWTGLPTLKTKPISRASAIQRAGRAGRTCPGKCVRLYHKADLDKRAPYDAPEIQRADLAQTFLEMKILSASKMEWFENPPDQAWTSARILLERLGALDDKGDITKIGHAMSKIPLHPRLSRMLLDSVENNSIREAASAAALISEGSMHRLNLLDELDTKDPVTNLTRERLLRLVGKPTSSTRGDVAACVLKGFPDRVARLNEARNLLVLCEGGSAQIHDSKILPQGEYFVCVDVRESIRGTHKRIEANAIVPIEPEWLLESENDFLRETNEMIWDEQRKSVFQISRILYGQLVLNESRESPKNKEAAAQVLAKKARENISEITDLESFENLKARIAFLRTIDESWPELEPDRLLEKFSASVCDEKFSLSELKNSDFQWFVIESLGPKLKSELERLAPSQIMLQGGRKVRVNYPPNQTPWIESRLQDFFGMRVGPSIMNGKIPVAVHLLAPNKRAVQVTTDLMSFWKNVYPKLRVELGRRYPRHKWPQDPVGK